MSYPQDFDPHGTREHNEELRQEIRKLHLEWRLRQNCQPRFGARLGALVSKGAPPLLGRVTLAR